MLTAFLLLLLLLLLGLGLGLGRQRGALPGPLALPLLGHLPHLLHPHLPQHLLRLAQRHGPLYCLHLGSRDVLVLNTAETIREALLRHWGDLAGRPPSYLGALVSLGGQDLSLGDVGEPWRRQRRAATSGLLWAQRQRLAPILARRAAGLARIFRSYEGAAVDLTSHFTLHTAHVICDLIFGPMMPSEAEIRDFTACITELVQLWSCISIQALDTVPLLRILPNPSLQRLLQVVEKRDAFVRAQIQRHQESLEPERPRDVVDHLLLAMGDLGPKRLHMALVDLFIGGTETTAALLAWACAFLVRHPEVQDRIHAELQDVLGPTAPLRPRDRDRLPLLSATLNETLRLRPPVPLALPHRTTRPTSVAGMSIPQDTIVIPNLFAAHHDETKWLEPEEFRPERFLAPGALRDLLPFSCGARACPGEALARAEALVTLGRLLREFRLEPAVLGTLPALSVVSFGIVLRCPSLCLRLVPRPRAPPPARGHTLVTPLPGVMTPLPGELP